MSSDIRTISCVSLEGDDKLNDFLIPDAAFHYNGKVFSSNSRYGFRKKELQRLFPDVKILYIIRESTDRFIYPNISTDIL